MNQVNQASCPQCNVAYIATQQKQSVSAGGVFGALIGLIGLFAMIGNFVIGLMILVFGIIIGSVGRKTMTVLVCPLCKKKVEL